MSHAASVAEIAQNGDVVHFNARSYI